MKIVVSPVGTSVLTNYGDYRLLINKYSNTRKKESIPRDDLIKIEELLVEVKQRVMGSSIQEVSEYSAELHGILSYYNCKLQRSQDIHYLIPSDTFIGRETMKIIGEYLDRYFIVVPLEIQGIQTNVIEEFQLSLADLAKKIIEIYEGKGNKELVFNLTGGFKAVQGFLLTLGMHYADESVYIFERSSHLMKIPKLPIKLVPEDVIVENLNVIRRINLGLEVKPEELTAIPNTLVLSVDTMIMLSGWGEIVWDKAKRELYGREVYRPPSELVIFSDKFKQTTSNLSSNQYYDLNVRLDDLSIYLKNGRKECPKSLNFKKITDKKQHPQSDHEFYAWSDKDAKRVFCHFEGEKLILDALDKHL
jgi:putative CRISPR-associated protein (TIGR02619 family)